TACRTDRPAPCSSEAPRIPRNLEPHSTRPRCGCGRGNPKVSAFWRWHAMCRARLTETNGCLMHDDRFLAACAVARAAGRLARRYLEDRPALAVEWKGAQDPVSAADKAAEALIVRELARAFPGDGFLGEEGGGQAAERLWVIDPIDGTANYV